MKLIVLQKDLRYPIQLASGILRTRSSINSIMNNIVCEAIDDKITFVGSDSDMEIAINTLCKEESVIENGCITIPGKKLFDAWKTFPEDSMIDVSLSNSKICLKSGKREFNLTTMPASEYTRMDKVSVSLSVDITIANLLNLIRHVKYAVAEQDVRPYLNGMLLHAKADEIYSVATDAHRMSVYKTSYVDGKVYDDIKEFKAIIPRKGIFAISRFLGGDTSSGNVTLHFSPSYLKVETKANNSSLITKLIDGNYPNYQKLIYDSEEHNMVCSKHELQNVLDCANILSYESHSQVIDLSVEKNKLLLHSKNSENELFEEEIASTYDGEPFKVSFMVDYLKDVVTSIDNDNISFCMKDIQKGFLIRDEDDHNGTYLVMPVVV